MQTSTSSHRSAGSSAGMQGNSRGVRLRYRPAPPPAAAPNVVDPWGSDRIELGPEEDDGVEGVPNFATWR